MGRFQGDEDDAEKIPSSSSKASRTNLPPFAVAPKRSETYSVKFSPGTDRGNPTTSAAMLFRRTHTARSDQHIINENAEIPAEIYKLDIEKSASASLEIERYWAIDFFRAFVNRAWRTEKGHTGINDPKSLSPPNLKNWGRMDTCQSDDLDFQLRKPCRNEEEEEQRDQDDHRIGPFSTVVSFLLFPVFTVKRSPYCRCCCPKRRLYKKEDMEDDDDHPLDHVDPKYNFSCGFDGLFNKWRAGTKRHEWPLRSGNVKTLDEAGMHIVIKNFWWFCYLRNIFDTCRCMAMMMLKGACLGIYPYLQGRMTQTLNEAVDDISDINNNVLSADEGKVILDAKWHLFMWLGIYFAVWFVEHIAEWLYELWLPGSGLRRDFRFMLAGRMLKFKPLPVPGEASNIVYQAVIDAMVNIWYLGFNMVEQQSALVVLFVVLIIDNHQDLNGGALTLLFVLPIFILCILLWLNYWIRRHNSADLARRKYDWTNRMHGYVAAQIDWARGREYDLDDECQSVWRILASLRCREFGWFFWNLNSWYALDALSVAMALIMIYISGTKVLLGDIKIGSFVTIASAYFAMMSACRRIMQNLMQWPIGYEGVLRMAAVINNSDLKTAYQDPSTGLGEAGQVFLREIDIARLIRIVPEKLRKIDLRRIRRMNLQELAPMDQQRLKTVGVDLPTLQKVSHLTEIVEQFQAVEAQAEAEGSGGGPAMEDTQNSSSTAGEPGRQPSDGSQRDAKPLLGLCEVPSRTVRPARTHSPTGRTSGGASLEEVLKELSPRRSTSTPAADAAHVVQRNRRASRIGQIWPQGRPMAMNQPSGLSHVAPHMMGHGVPHNVGAAPPSPQGAQSQPRGLHGTVTSSGTAAGGGTPTPVAPHHSHGLPFSVSSAGGATQTNISSAAGATQGKISSSGGVTPAPATIGLRQYETADSFRMPHHASETAASQQQTHSESNVYPTPTPTGAVRLRRGSLPLQQTHHMLGRTVIDRRACLGAATVHSFEENEQLPPQQRKFANQRTLTVNLSSVGAPAPAAPMGHRRSVSSPLQLSTEIGGRVPTDVSKGTSKGASTTLHPGRSLNLTHALTHQFGASGTMYLSDVDSEDSDDDEDDHTFNVISFTNHIFKYFLNKYI